MQRQTLCDKGQGCTRARATSSTPTPKEKGEREKKKKRQGKSWQLEAEPGEDHHTKPHPIIPEGMRTAYKIHWYSPGTPFGRPAVPGEASTATAAPLALAAVGEERGGVGTPSAARLDSTLALDDRRCKKNI